ncbi:FH1/FH2 domain-containing protein 3 isoform X2 [Chrysoperla carnea]|uniref:FH1/FH2 domain-containing protein 3 isoform X2 n=1 Tax=Chrysoperla carnea TaxID=189513 RepID=UPI001D083C33|nr:FH1/FH2 domain-containing protein 3 isoform X2 [Chrysoperla carnea]
MSSYRSYYDYRKSYETRSTNTTPSSSSAANSKSASSKSTTPKPEDEKVSKYTTSYRRFPQPSSVPTPESTSESKISKEMRAKYGPDGYKPKTDPPITYNNKKFDNTPRYSLSSSNTSSTPRSRGTSPVSLPKTESPLYSTYTPYKSGFSTTSSALNKDKTTSSTASSRRGSREDLTRVGTVTASLKPAISRYRTTSTSSTRGSREDLSRIGSSTRGTSLTRRDSSVSRRDSASTSKSSLAAPSTSISRRNSREELNKIGTTTTPLRYSGSTSLNRYSLTSPKIDNKLYSTSRRSPVPTSSYSHSNTTELSSLLPTPKSLKENDTPKQNDSQKISTTKHEQVNDDTENDTITVTVMTRGTSPTPPTQSTITRTTTKRSDIARQIQRDIQRPKIRPEMHDKEVQSDRTDDTARYSRYGGSTRSSSSTTSSWNSFLDIKYTSPTNSYSKYTSPRNSSISATSSGAAAQNKNDDKSSVSLKKEKSDSSIKSTKTKSSSSSIPAAVSKSSNERVSPIKLPPTVPKSPSSSSSVSNKNNLSTSQHSLEQINKDFRKSVLNMNQFSKQKSRSKGSVASSSDSEASSKSNLQKKPVSNKIKDMKSPSRSRSTSTDSSASSNIKGSKSKSEILDPDSLTEPSKSESQSRTSQGVSELITDDQPAFKFKIRPAESGEVAWWLQKTPTDSPNNSTNQMTASSPKQTFSIRPVESGERAWWLGSDTENDAPKSVNNSASNITNTNYKSFSSSDNNKLKVKPIRLIESGERAWWLNSDGDSKSNKSQVNNNSSDPDFWSQIKPADEDIVISRKQIESSDEEDDSTSDELENYVINSQGITEPLGDRLSPDGIEATSCEDEMYSRARLIATQFISKHTNIDDLLNTEPIRENYRNNSNSSSSGAAIGGGSGKLDDSALQLYKDGDYGAYLDLEASISEQQEEFDGFQDNRKNSIILRTQLSVRVHSIIEKLLNSESRELRRSLFSLKQIFQEDKDLVHEFVQNDGLSCLIKVGTEIDQNYQNYILRALGQLMLYVDGMNGVIEHNLTIQWLYSLIASKCRLVVKTALKLLVVFVEYVETNCILLIKAVNIVDHTNGNPQWYILMRLLKDYDQIDTELLIYAMTLINKCLNGIPDQDTYYDQVDCLEEQGIENIIQKYMSRQCTNLDLLRQFQIYEAVLEYEDGDHKTTSQSICDEAIRKTLRNRKSVPNITSERRKSRRHSTGTSALTKNNFLKSSSSATGINNNGIGLLNLNNNGNLGNGNNGLLLQHQEQQQRSDGEDESSSSQSSQGREKFNGVYNDNKDANQAGVTPALRRRRERAERQRSFIREQETAAVFGFRDENKNNGIDIQRNNSNGSVKQISSRGTLTPQLSAENNNKHDSELEESNTTNGILKKPWAFQMMYSKSHDNNDINNGTNNNEINRENENNNQFLQLNKENSVKDLTQKLSSQNILHSPSPIDENRPNRIGDMTGLIFKAKEGLAKSKSKIDVLRSPTNEQQTPKFTVPEVKKTESELHWEELARTINRPLNLCDLDFTDLASGDELDVLAPSSVIHGGPPPPPPPSQGGGVGVPSCPAVPPICPSGPPSCPPAFSSTFRGFSRNNENNMNKNNNSATLNKKNKKTVKLFWKEVREDPISLVKLQTCGNNGMIWDELKPVSIDTQKLEHLFESRAKDSLTKKQQELNKNKEIIVLDHKRSNAINIGMTKLPPPRTIKTAILKMDATIMNREGIEKLLTMLPTEEERTRIQDAQAANPDLPLGSAEQFLLTLASISELPARLKLWAFKLDFECSEREIAEPLMDLKQGTELLKINKTFRGILSTLLSIGIFLNGSDVKGFQIDYLAKVPEVKDTVHKHSLLHHLCHMVMEKFPESTDLYSEIGAITRVSKVDFDELRHNIQRLETDCKASWDHLKLIAKHDGTTLKVKMSDFLADCAERIILLSIIHRRVLNRYRKFLLWIGVPLHQVADTKPNDFCRIVSEFALEYRTTRERVLQQLEKKANHRERNKTRGKMITEVGKFSSKEERADAELRHVLGTSDISDIEGGGTLPWRRRKEQPSRLSAKIALNGVGDLTDADDEILESLVKTATKAPTTRTMPRERKRTRNVDRKSIKRSRTRESMYGVTKDSS